jgi:hypothetical protein
MTKKRHTPAVGQGHGGKSKLPDIIEVTNTARFQRAAHLLQPGSRGFQLGKCIIFVSQQIETGLYHMSISHPDRYSTWDEVAKARYDLLPPELDMVMHLPSPEQCINIHENCFQLRELRLIEGEPA